MYFKHFTDTNSFIKVSEKNILRSFVGNHVTVFKQIGKILILKISIERKKSRKIER